MINNQLLNFIESQLLNNEVSTDDEMKANFIENGLTEKEAIFYIAQRDNALKLGLDFQFKIMEA